MVSKITILILQFQGHQRSYGGCQDTRWIFPWWLQTPASRVHQIRLYWNFCLHFIFIKCVFIKNDGAHLATSEMCSLVCLRGPGVFSDLWEHWNSRQKTSVLIKMWKNRICTWLQPFTTYLSLRFRLLTTEVQELPDGDVIDLTLQRRLHRLVPSVVVQRGRCRWMFPPTEVLLCDSLAVIRLQVTELWHLQKLNSDIIGRHIKAFIICLIQYWTTAILNFTAEKVDSHWPAHKSVTDWGFLWKNTTIFHISTTYLASGWHIKLLQL